MIVISYYWLSLKSNFVNIIGAAFSWCMWTRLIRYEKEEEEEEEAELGVNNTNYQATGILERPKKRLR